MAPASTLDLRHLAPPEPMERILAVVASLAPDDCLEALTPLYPAPLLAILHADGFATQVEPIEDGYRVRIVHADSASDPERTCART